jgi:L-ascorbate metabolism protein UlaG (beta-lactamase superfamily)
VSAGDLEIRWWGHATTTLTVAGVRVLTDPVLVDRLAHLRRLGGPTPAPAAARADVAVVSHLHADHLHLPSLQRLAPSCRVVVPRGAAAVVRRTDPGLAERVEEVDVGDEVVVGPVTLRAVPAHHDGRRLPGSRHRGPALGFVVAGDDRSVWFAGDTGLFDGLAAIGPVDVAVVPVGGWGPTLGPHHLDPEQAADAVARVGAHDAVPVHYGTFWPAGLRQVSRSTFQHRFREPGARFAAAAPEHCPEARVHVLCQGDAVELPARARPRPSSS